MKRISSSLYSTVLALTLASSSAVHPAAEEPPLPVSAASAANIRLPAYQSADDDIVAAREAYRSNNLARLSSISQNMPTNYPLKDYPAFWLALKSLDQNNDGPAQAFLSQVTEGLMPERVRNEWIKKLGQREEWGRFAEEWKKLPAAARDEESTCYGELLALNEGKAPVDMDRFLESRSTPTGCNRLIVAAAQKGLVSSSWLELRARLLLAGNFSSLARQLATATGLPLDSGQNAMSASIARAAKADLSNALSSLMRSEASLSPEQASFAWGQLALVAARKLQSDQALQWFAKADPKQLATDQWEWWARSAMRQEQWQQLNSLLQLMPKSLAEKTVWRYWRGRALQQMGQTDQANAFFRQAGVGNHYYAVLAREALGQRLSTPKPEAPPSSAAIAQAYAQPAIQRALSLLAIAQRTGKNELRTDAQREWRWTARGRSDAELLAAAAVGREAKFYDMAIYSAEQTTAQHDFELRYLTPHREVAQRYAQQYQVDDAWVYGLIRQESRFITLARSGVGASGLMQLMPATASWAAKKIGLGSYSVNDIDTNVQLGTWYMRHVLDQLSNNEILASAAYNAGPGRARAWQTSRPLDGTIYAETIPFNETRDYVQKVMSNASYYASTFGRGPVSLKERMGVVPAR